MANKTKSTVDKLAGKRAITKRVSLVMDSALVDARAAVEDRVKDARNKVRLFGTLDSKAPTDTSGRELAEAKDSVAALEVELEAADAALAESAVEFTFKALSKVRYAELIRQYPPTEQQKADFAEQAASAGLPKSQQTGLRYDFDAFPPALVEVCLIDPALEAGTVAGWWESDDWNENELATLFTAAEMACRAVAELPR